MAEQTSHSKYMRKVMTGVPSGPSNTRARRECDRCHRTLPGKRGHGFPSQDARAILCGGIPMRKK